MGTIDFGAPDVLGEIIGWRAWRILRASSRVMLTSVICDDIWPSDRYFVASCAGPRVLRRFGALRGVSGGGEEDEQHVVPDEGCTCGIYAARDRDQLFDLSYGHYGSLDNVHVIGKVALSGKVIQATQGWRAARARVFKLYVPHSAWKLVRALEHYNVPVELTNPFK